MMPDIVTLPSIHLKQNSVSDVCSPSARMTSLRTSAGYSAQLAEQRYNQYVLATGHHVTNTNRSIPTSNDTYHVNTSIEEFERLHGGTTAHPVHTDSSAALPAYTKQHSREEEKACEADCESMLQSDTDALVSALACQLECGPSSDGQQYAEQLHLRAAQVQADIQQRRLQAATVSATLSGTLPAVSVVVDTSSNTEHQLHDSAWHAAQHARVYNANSKLMQEQIAAEQERIRLIKMDQAERAAAARQAEFDRAVQYNVQRVQSAAQHKRLVQHNGVTQFCTALLHNIIDLSATIATYRQISDDTLVPQALYSTWIQQLHQQTHHSAEYHTYNAKDNNSSNTDITLQHYIDCVCDWSPANAPLYYVHQSLIDTHPLTTPDNVQTDKRPGRPAAQSAQISGQPAYQPVVNNELLGNIVRRLFDIHCNVLLAPDQPVVPAHPPAVAVIGKPYSGKSTLAHYLSYKYGVAVIDAETLVSDAICSYDRYVQSSSKQKGGQLTVQQQIGQKLKKSLQKHVVVSDDIYVSLIKYAVEQCSAGYVLLNFPNTVQQAKLLEAALSGYVESKPAKHGTPNTATDKNERIHSNMAKPNKAALTSSTVCVSALHCVMELAAADQHCITNALKQVATQPSSTAALNQTVPHGIQQYSEAQPALQEWFHRFHILHTIDANQSSEAVKECARHIIQDVMKQINAEPATTHDKVHGVADVSVSFSPTVHCTDVYDVSQHNMYDRTVTALLTERWQICEHTYCHGVESILAQRHHHVNDLISHLHTLRNTYLVHLRTNDPCKQQLVDKFVQTFNSVPHSVRADLLVKNELHMRLDEFCDQLFNCSLVKQKQCEQLIVALLNDTWLDTQCAQIQAHYNALCQQEINRYIHVCSIVLDYFTACKSGVLHAVPCIELSAKHVLPTVANEHKVDKVRSSKAAAAQNKSHKAETIQSRPVVSAFPPCSHTVLHHVHTNVLLSTETALSVVQTRAADSSTAHKDKSKRRGGKNAAVDSSDAAVSPYDQLLNAQLAAVVEQENSNLLARLHLCQRNSECEIHQLRLYYVQVLIARLDEWLGARVRAESQAVDALAAAIQQSIEAEQPIYHQLVLDGQNALLDSQCVLSEMPSLKAQHQYTNSAIHVVQ